MAFTVEFKFDGPAELTERIEEQVRRGFQKVAPDLSLDVTAAPPRKTKKHGEQKRRYVTIALRGVTAASPAEAERKGVYWLRRAVKTMRDGYPERVKVTEE